MSATGSSQQLTAGSTLSDNASYSITARTTNAAGSEASSSALALNIDTAPPTAPPLPDLLTASDLGSSNSDNITSDATPTFNNASAGTNGVVVTINSSQDGNVGTATIAGGNYSIVARAPKTGTITALTSSTAVVGAGTSFTTELAVGRNLFNAAGTTFIGTIASITDNTNLVLTANASNAITAAAYSQGLRDGNHNVTATTSDVAGNIGSTTPALVVTIDTQAPSIQTIERASANPTTAASVSYTVTFNESVQATTVTNADFGVTTVSGDATGTDGNPSPNSGNASTYTIAVTGITGNGKLRLDKNNNAVTDVAGNSSTATFASGEEYDVDNVNPTLTLTTPAASSSISSTNVTYTLSEDLSAGAITWTRTGGTTDPSAPHTSALTGTELTAGTKTSIALANAPTLVNGAIYTVSLTGTDLATNVGTASTRTLVTFDNAAPNFTATAPVAASTVSNAHVSYTPSETLSSGTITWTRTGGSVDTNSPHVITLTGTELNTSAKANIILANNPTNLVNGAIYDVTVQWY